MTGRVMELTAEGGNKNQEWSGSCRKVAGERQSSRESREKRKPNVNSAEQEISGTGSLGVE